MTNELITNKPTPKKSHMPRDPMSKINGGIPRLDKAYQILDKVTLTTGTKAQVVASDGITLYNVDFEENTCTCLDNTIRGETCKHIRASKITHSQKIATELGKN